MLKYLTSGARDAGVSLFSTPYPNSPVRVAARSERVNGLRALGVGVPATERKPLRAGAGEFGRLSVRAFSNILVFRNTFTSLASALTDHSMDGGGRKTPRN